jgi:uncharacterized protein YbjT (DUF2867 family)
VKKVLVAGATGQLGREVVSEFQRRGFWVRGLVRDRSRVGPLEGKIDDIALGDVLQPETLTRACQGIDVVFSSVGASLAFASVRPVRTFADVDYAGNLHLLRAAEAAGVGHFMYVSVFGSQLYPELAYVKAHEDFARELAASKVKSIIIRPTGFFSVNGEILKMAQRGPVALIGSGSSRTNPIHEVDLARVCVDAFEHNHHDVEVGGPEIHTRREVVELAFQALGRKPRVFSIPQWFVRSILPLVRPFDRRLHDLFTFLMTVGNTDVVAPPAGSHRLEHYFRKQAENTVSK